MKPSKSRQKTTQKGLPTEHLRSWIELIPDAMVIVNQEGQIVLVNAQTEKLFGYQHKELLGQPVETLIPKRYHDMHIDYRAGYSRQPRARPMGKSLELRGLRKDGSEFAVEISLGSLKTGEGILVVAAIRDVTERKRAEEALRANRERLELLLSRSPAVTYSCELSGDYRCTYISENITAQLGYEPREFTSAPRFWADRIHPEDAQRIFAELPRLFETAYHVHEYRFRHKDGSYRWMHDQVKLVRDAAGNPLEAIGFWIDVTEHKQAEERINLLARALEASTDLISITDVEGRFKFANLAFLRTYGYTEEELLGKHYNLVRSPSIPLGLVLQVEEGIRHGGWQGELLNRRKDGSEFPIWLTAAQIKDKEGRVVGHLGSARDITERKRAEEAISKSESELRLVWEGALDGMRLTDAEGIVHRVNEAYCRLVGKPREALEGHPMSVVHAEARQREVLEKHRQRFRERNIPLLLERKITLWNGNALHLELSNAFLTLPAQRDLVLSVFRDITERKEAEKKLRERTAYLSALIENSPLAIVVMDSHHRIQMCNTAFERLFLYRQAEILGGNLDELVGTAETMSEAIENTRRVLAGETVHDAGRRRRADGTVVEVELHGVPLIVDGDFVGAYGLYQDISERKQAEETLRQSEQTFRQLVQSINETVYMVEAIEDTPSGGLVQLVSDQVETILGYRPVEFLEDPNLWFRLLHPDDVPSVLGSTEKMFRTKQACTRVYRLRHKNTGEYRWMEDRVVPQLDASGKVIGIFGAARDFTERKQAEEALRASEEKFAKAFRSNPAVISISTVEDGRLIEVNDTFIRRTGYRREEIIGRTADELNLWVNPADRERVLVALRKDQKLSNLELYFRTRSGEIHTGLCSAEMIRLAGQPCLLTVVEDVTERKQAEEALRQSEERFRTLVENSPALICTHDLDGTILSVNQTGARMLGYEPVKIIGRSIQDFLAPSVRHLSDNYLEEIRRERFVSGLMRVKTRSGEERVWAYQNTRCEEEGKRPYILGNAFDITERLRAEEALRDSEEKYRSIFEAFQDVFYRAEREGGITVISPSVLPQAGYDPKELIGRPVTDFYVNPSDHEVVETKLKESGVVNDYELQLKTKTRGAVDVSVSCHLVYGKDGQPVGVEGVLRDITERKRAQEAQELVQFSLDRAAEAILWTAQDGHFFKVNEAACRTLGYSQQELLSMTVFDIDPDLTPSVWAERWEASKQHGPFSVEGRHRAKNGRVFPVDIRGNYLEFQGKGWIWSFAHDITVRKQAEEALRLSEERLSKVFRASPAAISISTLHGGRFLDVNDTFLHLTGYERQEVIGHTALEVNLWPNPDDRARLVQTLSKQGTVRNAELNFRTKSGGLLVTLLSAELVTIGDEQCILAVVQDITDRKQAEDMLRGLSGRLLQVQDEERRRFARELHDQFAQTAAAVAMNLTRLARSAATVDERFRRLLSETCEMVERCVVDIRTFSYLLHPPLLDELGLLPALRSYADGFRERSSIHVELDLPDELPRLPRDVELTLFRIAQESLTNIHLHSGSRTARIGLALGSREVVLEVRDEGHGMPPGTIDGGGNSSSTLGVGITGMRERVRQLRGRLEIHSSSQGTTVRTTLPLAEGKK